MKRKIWKTMAPIIAATMMFSTVVQAAETAAAGSAGQQEAADNYTSMSKEDYIDWLLKELTNEEKVTMMNGDFMLAAKYGVAGLIKGIDRLNISDVPVADGEEGVNTNQEATQLPAAVMLASTWSEDSAYAFGDVIGSEASALGAGVMLTPRVNIVRDACSGGNGGNYQTLSEDPLVNGLLGAAEANGIQDNGVVANLKQMFGSSTGSAQGSTASIMNEQTMREVYLQIFDLVVNRADVAASMTNYSTINNAEFDEGYAQSSAWNWNTILREQMGFDGFIEPDWGRLDGTASLQGGVDWDPLATGPFTYETVEAAVNAGDVTWEEVDLVARNLLSTLYDYGFLDPEYNSVDPDSYFETTSKISDDLKTKNADTAKQIAEDGAVLLKNEDGTLPLSEDSIRDGKVAFIGYTADNLAQPTFKEASSGFYDAKTSALEAVAAKLNVEKDQIAYYTGSDMKGEMIPAENFKYVDEDGNEHAGLISYTSEQDENGEDVITYGEALEDMDHLGDKAVKGEDEEGNHTSLSYTGKIYAEESGEYRINVIQKFPDDSDYTDSDKTFMSGSLTINDVNVGASTRMIMNGAPNANSSVATADMGDDYNNWNLCGGYIELEAGNWYDISYTVSSIYGEDIEYALTWVTPSQREADVEEAVKGAESADTAVVFVWQDAASASTDADSMNGITNLKGGQLEMLKAVSEAYDKVVVVCNNGDAFNVGSFEDDADAILEMWWPGQEGGEATAALLLGEETPSGKLPVSFPASEEESMARNAEHQERYGNVGGDLADHSSYSYFTEGINNGYRTYISNNNENVTYEFGYGKSYTNFEWSDFDVTEKEDGSYHVAVTVTNTGDYAGKDVVQVYLGAPDNQPEGIQFSDLMLAGFAKTSELQPGDSETVNVEILPIKLSYWDSGEVGSLTADELQEMLQLGGSDAETAKAEAAEWYSKHNPDYEGEWVVAEGTRKLYVMTSADWDNEVYSTEIDVQAAADVTADGDTVEVPITVKDATVLASVTGEIAYDSDVLELDSIRAAEGFDLSATDGATFTLATSDGSGCMGDTVIGYATFKVKAADSCRTLVSFPATKRESADSYGRVSYEAMPTVTVGVVK